MALALQQYIRPYSRTETKVNRFLKDRTLKQRQQISLVVIADKHKQVLSEDLIVEILSWLPVKTLLQFKCVCKSWYTIIKTSHFISKHLQHYYNNHDTDCFLVYYQVTQAGELELYELLLDETHNKVVAYDKLDGFPIYSCDICGPCNGIYYLYLDYREERALWNPALNELKMLPSIVERPANLPIDLYGVGKEVYGFGYDPSSNDFKVIVIQGLWQDKKADMFHAIDIADDPSSVFIYSMRTNSWRYWGNLAHNYSLETNRCYVIVNGSCYWLGYIKPCDKDYEVIVCFDIVKEEYHEISVPKYGQFCHRDLAIHDDRLALLSLDDIQHFHIWTLDDMGHWMKKYTLGAVLSLWNPIGHWKNNKILLQYGRSKLVICDPDTHELTDIEFIEVKYCHGAFVYQESLVSLKG